MQLIHLKEEIDAGWTAKLILGSSLVTITIRVKKIKHEDVPCYAWQIAVEGVRPYPEIPPVNTRLFATWEQLLSSIGDSQKSSTDWTRCRDTLLDYLPPERKTLPGPE